MVAEKKCILCGYDVTEINVPKQDIYEITCKKTCGKYWLTPVYDHDKAIEALPEEDRKILSNFVKLQYKQTRKPVFLESIEMAKSIIERERAKSSL